MKETKKSGLTFADLADKEIGSKCLDSDLTSFGGKSKKATVKSESTMKLGPNRYVAIFKMSDGGEVLGYGKTANEAKADAKRNAKSY